MYPITREVFLKERIKQYLDLIIFPRFNRFCCSFSWCSFLLFIRHIAAKMHGVKRIRFTVNSWRWRTTGSGENNAYRFQKEGKRLHVLKERKKWVRNRFSPVPFRKRNIGAYGPFFERTGKTGTGQVSFRRKNLSEPFHIFRSCKRAFNCVFILIYFIFRFLNKNWFFFSCSGMFHVPGFVDGHC